ncbi:hypothetical protein SAMD00019534_123820 [Acytostelium subglobosum LB1]|uniref:hypothetical protein n=1 Tax=Acytostelium subglobosum LB1 TaxID=1410327 RepID=UPI000644E802|nr:hypothetical protein SAMD00019534_123820 [Acytostelium subglobosum LB1]GAM29206.1 hypothetical protein SAMD00019534_123820 [Acytostelium subglobosum LB1]|eukprot:XP_012747897.1 hypothetical protein SAMD00019534_123820 [Acytostelium subglobosum LB1]
MSKMERFKQSVGSSCRLKIKETLADKNDHDKATMLAAIEIQRRARLIKDLIKHIVFFVAFMAFIILQRNSNDVYQIGQTIKSDLLFNGFTDITNQAQFNTYLTTVFASTIQNMSFDNPYCMTSIISETVRVRQLRVAPNSCPSRGLNLTCYSPVYYKSTRETRDIVGPTATYKFSERSGEPLVFGYNQYTYEPSGYYIDLPIADVSSGIESLINNSFFNYQTRAVIISFVTFSISYESRVTVVYLLLEYSASGSIDPYYSMRTYRINMYSTATDGFRAFLELLFLIFLIYYIYNFINEARIDYKLGRISYFIKSFWNVLDIVNISLFISSVVLFFIFLSNKYSGTIPLEERGIYPVYLEEMGQTALVYFQLSAINILLLSFKTFRYLIIHRRLYAIWITIANARIELLAFTIMFLIIMIGFLTSGWLTFGHDIPDYYGFIASLGTSLQFIMGNPPSFQAMTYTNRALGPIYTLLFIIFMFLILMNMFIAIISNSYSEVNDNIMNKQKAKRTMLTKWKRYYLSLKFLFRRNIYDISSIVIILMEKRPGLMEERGITPERMFEELQLLGLGFRYDEAQYYSDLLMKVNSERKKFLQEIVQNKNAGGTFELKLIGQEKILTSVKLNDWNKEQEKMEKCKDKQRRNDSVVDMHIKLDRILQMLGDPQYMASNGIDISNIVGSGYGPATSSGSRPASTLSSTQSSHTDPSVE